MRKKLIALAMIAVFAFALTGCGFIQTVGGPDLEKPVFVKMFVYADDMDVDLHYICDQKWDKAISKIEIPNAPKEVSCVVYDEEDEAYEGKYTVMTAHMGVGDDRYDDDGLPEDISFSELLITWDDGTTTTEDVGHITIASEDIDYNNTNESGGSEPGDVFYEVLDPVEKRTEITGFEVPFKEMEKIIDEVTLNDTPLSEISAEHPLVLEKGESCEFSISLDRSKAPEYGEVWVAAKLLKKSGDKEVKYTNVFINERFNSNVDVKEYLRAVLN